MNLAPNIIYLGCLLGTDLNNATAAKQVAAEPIGLNLPMLIIQLLANMKRV